MLFESYERRIGQITPVLEKYGMKTLEEANELCLSKGIEPSIISLIAMNPNNGMVISATISIDETERNLLYMGNQL